MDVAIDAIKPSPYQPRLTFEVKDLKEEIQRDGLLSALVVRKRDEYYELLDGERRLRALKEMGWKSVPVDVREVDDKTARRSVFKLNSIRENYTTEEKARYFKKLADDDKMTAYQVGQELNVDDNWVRAHLNVFLFPHDVQQAVWANELSVATIRELEPLIGANLEEATIAAREAIARKLSSQQVRETLRPRVDEIEKARIEAARKALEAEAEKLGAAAPILLETPEDYEKAAEALRREALRQREEAMTPEERAALEAEKKAKLEAQAMAKAQREEERKQREAERRRQFEEAAMRRVRQQLMRDPQFVKEAWEKLPSEAQDVVMGISAQEREKLEQGRPPRTPMDAIYELDDLAENLYHRLGELEAIPSAGIAILGTTLRSLQGRITEVLRKMGLFITEGR